MRIIKRLKDTYLILQHGLTYDDYESLVVRINLLANEVIKLRK